MLKNSNFSIGEIAERVGYTYETGLNKALKRSFGVGPRQFRGTRNRLNEDKLHE